MSNAAKSKAVAVAAKLAGQFATWGAGGVPVGPLAEEVTGDLLGALLDVQDEQLATLRNIEKSVTQIGQDVAQLREGPYRTAREMVERAMIPGRSSDVVKADLQAASIEFLRAASQHPDATLPRASAYMEASLVQGLLGDEKAMQYYCDKAWKEGIATLRRETGNAKDAIRRPSAEKARRGRRSFWSLHDDREFNRRAKLLEWGDGGEDLADTFPEARVVYHLHQTRHQVDVYRDVAANLLGGPDVLPYQVLEANLWSLDTADVAVWQVYDRKQIESFCDTLAFLLRKVGINENLYALKLRCKDHSWIEAFAFETIDAEDLQAVAFQTEVKRILPYGLPVSYRMVKVLDYLYLKLV